MPMLTEQEAESAIASGNVFAVSIDTAVFDTKQKSFQNTALRRLDQFHSQGIRVVITDVVANEMKAHLRDYAWDSQRALKKALRAHTIRWKRQPVEGESEQLLLATDPASFAETEIASFLDHINGEIIKVSETPDVVDRVLACYFAEDPPFGSASKRKSEFPDAFALFRLEDLAASEGRLLICVTPDKGWAAFAAQSDHLVCVDRLEDALALFNAADQTNQRVAVSIVQKWRNAENGDFLEGVERAIEYRLDDVDFDIDAHADVLFVAEALGAALQYVHSQTIGDPTVIAADDETLTFNVRLEALVSFEALFSFLVIDSVDKDYVQIGEEVAYVEKKIPFELTISVDRGLDEGPEFYDAEVVKRTIEVDFGYVEAFPNEDPTHEKY